MKVAALCVYQPLCCAYCGGLPTEVIGKPWGGHKLSSMQCLNIGCPGQRTRMRFGAARVWNQRQRGIAREIRKARSVIIPLMFLAEA